MNNQYGEMLEESFASIFAEVCINNARIKLRNNFYEKNEWYSRKWKTMVLLAMC